MHSDTFRPAFSLAAFFGIGSFALVVGVVVPAISYYGRYAYWSSSAAASTSRGSGITPDPS